MEVHHILLLLWVIVFAFWFVKQMAASNRKMDKK